MKDATPLLTGPATCKEDRATTRVNEAQGYDILTTPGPLLAREKNFSATEPPFHGLRLPGRFSSRRHGHCGHDQLLNSFGWAGRAGRFPSPTHCPSVILCRSSNVLWLELSLLTHLPTHPPTHPPTYPPMFPTIFCRPQDMHGEARGYLFRRSGRLRNTMSGSGEPRPAPCRQRCRVARLYPGALHG